MDLEDFVATALGQIVRGIKRAQEETADTGVWINPVGKHPQPALGPGIEVADNLYSVINNVEFDVALTAVDKTEGGAKAGLKIFAAELGAGGKLASENSTASRLHFKVPVAWPGVRREDLEQKRAGRRTPAVTRGRNFATDY